MSIEDLGFDTYLKKSVLKQPPSDLTIGRVVQEHRERYTVSDGTHAYEAEVTGNLRFTASKRADFPAVGDWVTMMIYDKDTAIIHQVLPRFSTLERQAIGKYGEKQIISTNIDEAFIIQAIGQDFNINRLERYLAICHASNITPITVISKVDTADQQEINELLTNLEGRGLKVRPIFLSNITRQGLDLLLDHLHKGKTYCVIGSSGVGKSTLINNLQKRQILKTGSISVSTHKGRHITTFRELMVLENGSIIIDTPGMRELGVTETKSGIDSTFDEISALATQCRFSNCTHQHETGCAVISAVNAGTISAESLKNYRKLLNEQERFQTSIREKRKKDKVQGRMYKGIMKERKRNKS